MGNGEKAEFGYTEWSRGCLCEVRRYSVLLLPELNADSSRTDSGLMRLRYMLYLLKVHMDSSALASKPTSHSILGIRLNIA